jgi:hypothetical protein
VFQGVHQAFEVREHKPWPQPNPALPPDQQPPPPLTRLVFIGRNLDKPSTWPLLRVLVTAPVS